MIPEPWAGHETHDAGAEGVLRVPLVADGAVGRPGVDRVHRRHGDRRGARSQRPAAVALLRDEGRPGRSWRPRSACSTSRPRTSCVKGRLQPGRMFLVDTAQGRIVADEEIKRELAAAHPYGEWLDEQPGRHRRSAGARRICRRPATRRCCSASRRSATRTKICGILLAPMATSGEEPIGSMGTDTPLAVLSDRAAPALRLLQAALRAGHQPAARRDPRGAGDVDGVDDRARRATCSSRGPESCRQIKIKYPIIDNDQTREAAPRLRAGVQVDHAADALRRRARAARASQRAMERAEAERERRGRRRLHDPDPLGPRRRSRPRADSEPAGDRRRAPSPGPRGHAHAAAAWSSRSGDAREVHHCALLLGYGAGVVNPYLAFETLDDMIRAAACCVGVDAREGGRATTSRR